MNERQEQEHQVRRFLLGQLEAYEHQRFEESLMVNPEYQQQVLMIEDALIEDYLDGLLSADELKAFDTHFLASAQQRRKVKVVKLLGAYGTSDLSDSNKMQPPAPPQRRWPIGFRIRNHPVVFASVAAALLLISILGIFQTIWSGRETTQRQEATRRRLDVERELAQLNSTPSQNIKASTFPLILLPISLRDANARTNLSIPLPAEIIEVRLVLSEKIYSGYAAELSKIGTSEKFSIAGLQAQSSANGRVVVVRLPSTLLSHGDYKLSLTGTLSDNTKTVAGEYPFQVGL